MTQLLPLLLLTLTPAAEAPLVGRPREHFYGAVGEQVRVELRAAPTELRAEDPFVLTLTVRGVANPEKVERPDLRQLPEFAERFHVEDLPDEGPAATSRRFRYRLRPKSERVRDVPPLVFHYYHPRLNYFATTAPREAIALRVAPRDPPPAAAPQHPDFLFEFPDDAELLRKPVSDSTRTGLLFVAAVLPPLGFLFWLVYWRTRYPNAARLARLRRTRALREALDRLDGLAGAPELPDRVAAVVRDYLRERAGLPASAATPAEIEAELAARKAPETVVSRAGEFFRRCDAARFGPGGPTGDALATAARELVIAVEDST